MSDEKLKEIHSDIKEIQKDLKDFTQIAITNRNDIKWIRGGLKLSLGAVISIISGLLVYFFKSN